MSPYLFPEFIAIINEAIGRVDRKECAEEAGSFREWDYRIFRGVIGHGYSGRKGSAIAITVELWGHPIATR
jgi:hypothetical protein